MPAPQRNPTIRTRKALSRWWQIVMFALPVVGFGMSWLYVSLREFGTGQRFWPWSAYALCGQNLPDSLPATVRVGLYEEYPNPWRLAKLKQLDFPVTLAIATPSRAEFLRIRSEILATYPQVREVVFWPTLTQEEGYYPGLWSDTAGIQRVIGDANDLPVLWDLEVPRGTQDVMKLAVNTWWANRAILTQFFKSHAQPVHIWRTHVSTGFDSLFLRLLGMYIDPASMPNARLHLDMYATGEGQDAQQLARIIRCGVERYGERFIPALGVLNDNEGPPEVFVPTNTFKRNLEIARANGASEVWIFGANGLNPEYLAALHASLPLEKLPATP
jgi:hypothetical protein